MEAEEEQWDSEANTGERAGPVDLTWCVLIK